MNIGGLEDLRRTQCQLTPRLIYVAHSHCMQRAENPPLLQPMPGAHILTHRILKIEGNIWYEVGLPNLSTSNLSPPKSPPPPVHMRLPLEISHLIDECSETCADTLFRGEVALALDIPFLHQMPHLKRTEMMHFPHRFPSFNRDIVLLAEIFQFLHNPLKDIFGGNLEYLCRKCNVQEVGHSELSISQFAPSTRCGDPTYYS